MTLTPTTHNRDIKFAVAEMSKRPNLMYFTLSDGVNVKELWVMLLSVGLVILAAAGGGSIGWLIAGESSPDRIAITILGAAVIGVPVGMFILDWLLAAGKASYEAEFGEDTRPKGRSIARAAGTSQPRAVFLTEDDQRLLQTFAQRYPMVGLLGVNNWEGSSSPFFWVENKTEAIKRVHNLLKRMRLVEPFGSNGIKLNAAGEARLAEWRDGIFESPDPPAPGDAS